VSVWSPRLSVRVSVPSVQRVHPCGTENHLKNWHNVRHQWPSSVPIILTCAPINRLRAFLSLLSFYVHTPKGCDPLCSRFPSPYWWRFLWGSRFRPCRSRLLCSRFCPDDQRRISPMINILCRPRPVLPGEQLPPRPIRWTGPSPSLPKLPR
jgi:hypothetical protein